MFVTTFTVIPVHDYGNSFTNVLLSANPLKLPQPLYPGPLPNVAKISSEILGFSWVNPSSSLVFPVSFGKGFPRPPYTISMAYILLNPACPCWGTYTHTPVPSVVPQYPIPQFSTLMWYTSTNISCATQKPSVILSILKLSLDNQLIIYGKCDIQSY